jgi:hypothetical protein
MIAPGAWRITRSADGQVTVAGGASLDAAMIGAPEDEAPLRAMRLRSLCPAAHGLAVRLALGERASDADRHALALEAAAAAALRFALVWPLALGAPPDAAALHARTALSRGDAAALRAALLSAAEHAVRSGLAAALADGLGEVPDPERPGAPLAARFAAMAADAARRADALSAGLNADAPEPGAADVETVRGLLQVRLCTQTGKVSAFSSVSPTDRLMTPDGPAARACRFAKSAAQARLAVLALDPCARVDVAFAEERAHA